VQLVILFSESQVYVRPDASDNVLPFASNVTAADEPPVGVTLVRRFAASKVYMVPTPLPPESVFDVRLPIASKA
jgi:hypothetical protein